MNDATKGSSYKPVEAAMKVLSIIPLLAGNELTGLTPSQVAEGTGLSVVQVGNYLATLQQADFAEPIGDTGRWRLSARFMRIAMAHLRHVDAQQRALDEIKQRFSAPL